MSDEKLGLMLLLIIIYIFVGIRIIVACSKIFSKEMLQTHADNSQSKISMPFLSMKQRERDLCPNLIWRISDSGNWQAAFLFISVFLES